MGDFIIVKDKFFQPYISYDKIIQRIDQLSNIINEEYQGQDPLFLGILNGAFMFAAELYKRIKVDSNISFVKVSSYSGTKSTEHIKQLIGFDIPIKNRRIVVIEDIIDSGLTMKHIINQLYEMGAKDVRVVTLLFKPNAFKENFTVHYKGFEIPNDFIVGFGLDYDGYGRNYKDIYSIKDMVDTF